MRTAGLYVHLVHQPVGGRLNVASRKKANNSRNMRKSNKGVRNSAKKFKARKRAETADIVCPAEQYDPENVGYN